MPAYNGTHIYDLVIAVVVGVVAAVVLASVRRAAIRVSQRGSQRLSMPVFLVAGGLAVGVTALVADGLGAPSLDVLFSGQSAIPDLFAEDSTKIVLLLLLAKAVAYVISLASGVRCP